MVPSSTLVRHPPNARSPTDHGRAHVRTDEVSIMAEAFAELGFRIGGHAERQDVNDFGVGDVCAGGQGFYQRVTFRRARSNEDALPRPYDGDCSFGSPGLIAIALLPRILAFANRASLRKAIIPPCLCPVRFLPIRRLRRRGVQRWGRSALAPRDAPLRTSPLAFCLPTRRGSLDKPTD